MGGYSLLSKFKIILRMKIHHNPLGVGVFLSRSAIKSLIVTALVLKDAFKGRDSTLNQCQF